MKISSSVNCQTNFNAKNQLDIKKEENKFVNKINNDLRSYPANYYLNFCGGKSLNLAQTYEQIEKFGKFPQNIKERIEEELKIGNPEDKKLLDVHKEYYKGLLDCDTLEEIKFFYPEFEGVLTDKEVDYNKNSFMDKFKNSEFKNENNELILNPNKDLAVQLIQMYYADCLSSNDMKDILNLSPQAIMTKLNIKLLDNTYAKYLKLSDEEKNKVIAEAISRNANRTGSRKPHTRTSAPLTEQHRKNISEGLKKYYLENPDAIFKRTPNDIDSDPIKNEMFRQVMLRAWNYKEATPIKKAISKFLKRKDIRIRELIELGNETGLPDSKLGMFWSRNNWARNEFSKCMIKSWEKQKELEKLGIVTQPDVEFHYVPKKLEETIREKYPEIANEILIRQVHYGWQNTDSQVLIKEIVENPQNNIYNNMFLDCLDELGVRDEWRAAMRLAGTLLFIQIAKENSSPCVRELTKDIALSQMNNQPIEMHLELLKRKDVTTQSKSRLNEYIDKAWEIINNPDKTEVYRIENDLQKILLNKY